MIGKISTGATNDLERVTQLAYSQVAVYGMNEKIGLLSYRMDRDQFDKPYSNETAQMIDHEVRTFVDAAYKRTVAMVEEKKELIQAMATTLLEKEVINFDDVERLLGKRPFGSDHVRNIDRFRFGGDGTPPAASEDGAKEGASPSDSGSSGGDGGGPAGEPAIEEQGTLVERLRRRLEPGAVVAV
ncbi:osftsh8 oryza sativa ftsh protease,-like protein of atftsh3/10 [Dunaliella salina]|nr:osftsh8 oryza sativa ftsh protease,-like protein of atftsh3/10 [Dunaliella salina]|eukprot:KAF5837821.1 osftsh8 oryza sativa ftsh protease,-like protein of atftsh3/10 [Dunaliella salina]